MSDSTCPSCSNIAEILEHRLDEIDAVRMPRFEELINQNSPPLDIEAVQYSSVADSFADVMRDIDAKVMELEDAFERLTELRRRAARQHALAKRVMHPIKALPSDILVEIFLHCTNVLDPCVCFFEDVLHPGISPWNLSHVCRRWRDVSLAVPRLWSFVGLDFSTYAGVSQQQGTYKLAMYLQRSSHCALYVSLSEDTVEGIVNSEAHPGMIGLLELSAPRWRTLRATLAPQSLQAFSGATFARLHKLFYDPIPGTRHMDVAVFAHAPMLEEFVLAENGNLVPNFILPWAQMKHYYSGDALATGTGLATRGVALIRRMCDLETLCVALSDAMRNPADPPIVLSSLKHLSIDERDGGVTARVLPYFHFPSVRHLGLRLSDKSQLFFPALSNPDSLTSLELECDINVHPDDATSLLQFLSLTRNVERLRLRINLGKREVWIGLTITSERDSILPCLRVLDIHECYWSEDEDVTDNDILGMLESRIHSEDAARPLPRELQEIHVYVGWDSDWRKDTLTDRLRRWEKICQTVKPFYFPGQLENDDTSASEGISGSEAASSDSDSDSD
ncbi:hypothetical protein BDZ89DRAFT_1076496 [Hymenopellis radicata]|nr:hypothetical protein BDZ89DRAFT_1076496 [Hymenopellis radicata]